MGGEGVLTDGDKREHVCDCEFYQEGGNVEAESLRANAGSWIVEAMKEIGMMREDEEILG